MRTLGTINRTKINTSDFVSSFELKHKARLEEQSNEIEIEKNNQEIITEFYSGPVSILTSLTNTSEVILKLKKINKMVIVKNYNLIKSKIKSNTVSIYYQAIKKFININNKTGSSIDSIDLLYYNGYKETKLQIISNQIVINFLKLMCLNQQTE